MEGALVDEGKDALQACSIPPERPEFLRVSAGPRFRPKVAAPGCRYFPGKSLSITRSPADVQITRWIQNAVTGPGLRARPGSGSEREMESGLTAGSVLDGRYEIELLLGGSRTGRVYRGRDRKLDRPVAIKTLRTPGARGELTRLLHDRLRREAKALTQIRHPNVVIVYDVGSDLESGADFLVMELLEGGNLPSLIRRHGAPHADGVVRILRQAAAGVAAGHRHGVVHRDLRPSNLFLETAGDDFRVRVLDFGLAEVERAESPGPHDPSRRFLSPEQVGGATWVSPATDVFSLGAIGHFLLRGEPLWEAADPARAILEMEAARNRLKEDRTLPIRLRDVLCRALASHPEDRYADGRALLIALDEVGSVEVVPVETGPAASTEDARPEAEDEPTTVPATPPGGPARPVPAAPGALPPAAEYAGTASLVAGAATVCLLATFASVFNLIAAAMAIFGALELIELPSRAAWSVRLRNGLLSVGGLVLLGIMLARALSGSVADLLVAQLLVSVLLPRFTT